MTFPDKKNFKIELLTANTNYKDLISQAKKFNVKNIIITDFKSFKKTKLICKNKQSRSKNLKVLGNLNCYLGVFFELVCKVSFINAAI